MCFEWPVYFVVLYLFEFLYMSVMDSVVVYFFFARKSVGHTALSTTIFWKVAEFLGCRERRFHKCMS